MTNNIFHLSLWTDLTRDELHAIIRLRIDVFIVEQTCPYPDLDGKDFHSLHVWSIAEGDSIEKGDSATSCVRICMPGVSYKEPSIGRVATREDMRGTGLGKEVMLKAIAECEARWAGKGIRISAQRYLGKFYGDLGFEPTGEPYLEDDIPHIQMFRPSNNRPS